MARSGFHADHLFLTQPREEVSRREVLSGKPLPEMTFDSGPGHSDSSRCVRSTGPV